MTDERRRRFEQIERPREPGDEAPDPSPATDARFGAVEPTPPAGPAQARPGGAGPSGPPPAAPKVAPGHTDRFRPAAERPLEVDDLGEASQPFIRCARCETDCSRYTARCTTCGADLDTDEQRAFNARLWAGRRAEAGAEAAARAAHEATLEQARQEEARARRELAEAMAREVGQRERSRLDREVFGEPTFGPPSGEGWGGAGADEASLPPGLRLLALIPGRTWQILAGVAAVGLVAALFLLKPAAGLLAGAALLWLVAPAGWHRRRWW